MQKEDLQKFNLHSKVKDIFDWMGKPLHIKGDLLDDNNTLIESIREGYKWKYGHDLDPLNNCWSVQELTSFLVDLIPFEEDEVASEVLNLIFLNRQEQLEQELVEMIEVFSTDDDERETVSDNISNLFIEDYEVEEEMIDNLLSKFNKQVA